MTNRKRRQLEEQKRQYEEERRLREQAYASQQSEDPYGVKYGLVGNSYFPVANGSKPIQLPPIIQPISLVPFLDDIGSKSNNKPVVDEFEDDDDWNDNDDFDF